MLTDEKGNLVEAQISESDIVKDEEPKVEELIVEKTPEPEPQVNPLELIVTQIKPIEKEKTLPLPKISQPKGLLRFVVNNY